MATRAVPVVEYLWVEGSDQVVLFAASVEEVSSHPEVVTDLNCEAWSNLELPLTWHDFSVDT